MLHGSKQITNDYVGFTGSAGWGGPCTPPGEKPHNYYFTLYALSVAKLEPPANATASQVGFMVNSVALGKAVLIGTYGR